MIATYQLQVAGAARPLPDLVPSAGLYLMIDVGRGNEKYKIVFTPRISLPQPASRLNQPLSQPTIHPGTKVYPERHIQRSNVCLCNADDFVVGGHSKRSGGT